MGPSPHENDSRSAAIALRTGGALLVAAPLLTLTLTAAMSGVATAPPVGALALSAGLAVLAVGVHGAGSVTSRRPAGTVALVAFAIWTLLSAVLWAYALNPTVVGGLLTLNTIDLLVRLVLAAIAAVEIGRSGPFRSRLRWAPAWVLGATTAVTLGMQVAVGASAFPVFLGIYGLVINGGPVLLGVLAIALAAPARRESEPVAADGTEFARSHE